MRRFLIFFVSFMFVFVKNVLAIDTSADCACLILADTGEVIYEKNAYNIHQIASTTKIITGLLAIESNKLSETVTVSANAAAAEGSSIYIEPGNIITLEELVWGMLLNSGNDAACAVAEHLSGSIEEFAVEMTERARELGAVNTSFKNPSGLDADGHYSTAYDMALLTSHALENEKFREIVSTKNAQINVDGAVCYLKNHNKLLWSYEGCIGVKTGYTKSTGRCLVSAAERDGITLVAVTLGAPDDWNDHKKMLDYGFENTENKTVISQGEIMKKFNQWGFNAIASETFRAPVLKDKNADVEVILHTIKAPTRNIIKNEKIGYAECLYNGRIIKSIDILCDKDVIMEREKQSFLMLFLKLLTNFFDLSIG